MGEEGMASSSCIFLPDSGVQFWASNADDSGKL